MKYSVVIVAAGKGERLNLGYNKVYFKLNNRPLLEYSLDLFFDDERCREVIVVCDKDDFIKNMDKYYLDKVKLVKGGSSRIKSVINGLRNVEYDYVLVHDGARPYLSSEVIERVLDGLKISDSVLCMVNVKDTIKIVCDNYVEKTLDRDKLMAAQTPQGFKTSLYLSCLEKCEKDDFEAFDDTSVIERYSDVKTLVVFGDYNNIKVTTKEDL